MKKKKTELLQKTLEYVNMCNLLPQGLIIVCNQEWMGIWLRDTSF